MISLVFMPKLTFSDTQEMRPTMTDPSNKLPPEYDDFHPPNYDPSYTAHISTSMRMPERISVVNGHDAGDAQILLDQYNVGRTAANMNVPDRIMVAGQNQHIGMKEYLKLNLDFDPTNLDQTNHVNIQTPPRVLTLEDRPFPFVDDDNQARTKQTPRRQYSTPPHNGVIVPPSPSLYDTSMDGLLLHDSDADDKVLMHRQLVRLTRRVMNLEDENNSRSQREMIVYPLVIGYVLFQIAKWFLR